MAGVNVKMGVSGVSQFKTAMREAQGCVKTLDQALKLNEQQFKATGDSEAYMQQKAELLKSQIENQKNVVLQAENALRAMSQQGINPASTAFQKMQQEVLKAQGELLGMQTDLENIGVAGETAQNGVSGMNSQLQQIGKGVSWQNVTDGLNKINTSIGNVIKKAWEMGTALVQNTLGAGAWADELKTTADQWDITPEQLQRMRKTSGLIDTETDAILAARKRLTMSAGAEDNQRKMGAFAALGIDPNQWRNDVDGLFWEAGEGILKLTDAFEQEEYAQAIFGRNWQELRPLFKAGRQEYEETMASWNVVSDDALDNLGKMDDQYQKLTSEWNTFKMELLSSFSGPLTEGMEALTGYVEKFNEYLSTPEGKAAMKQIGDTMTQLLSGLTTLDPDSVMKGLADAVDKVKGAFEWIEQHHEQVEAALKIIGGGIVALKLAEAAANIGKLVTGFQTLWGGANNPMPGVPGAPAGGTGGASSGSGVVAGILNAVTLDATAGAMYEATEGNIRALTNEMEAQTAGMDAQTKSDFAAAQTLGMSLEEYQAWKHQKAMEKLPGGNGPGLGDEVIHKDRRAINQAYEENMDRLTRVAEQNAQTTQQFAQNSVTSADLQNLTGLPAAVAAAVSSAMANVKIIIGGGAVQSIADQTGSTFWGNVFNQINTVMSK